MANFPILLIIFLSAMSTFAATEYTTRTGYGSDAAHACSMLRTSIAIVHRNDHLGGFNTIVADPCECDQAGDSKSPDKSICSVDYRIWGSWEKEKAPGKGLLGNAFATEKTRVGACSDAKQEARSISDNTERSCYCVETTDERWSCSIDMYYE